MAIYRLEAKAISRAAGQSAVAASAYRAAEKLQDLRTGTICDYRQKGAVEHSEIITPKGAPEWMTDREKLWNKIEAAEKRKDARPAREIQITLPRELTAGQRLEAVRDFVRENVTSRGLVADVSWHNPAARDLQEQPHAHILITTRAVDPASPTGFSAKKDRDFLETPEQVEEIRANWADTANRHLACAGHEIRLDHRSLADQKAHWEREAQTAKAEIKEIALAKVAELSWPPEPKIGPVALKMEREGRAEQSHALKEALEIRQIRHEAASIRQTIREISQVVQDLAKEVKRVSAAVWDRLKLPARSDDWLAGVEKERVELDRFKAEQARKQDFWANAKLPERSPEWRAGVHSERRDLAEWKAEEARKMEAARQAELARKAEEARKIEQQRAEQERQAELMRQAALAAQRELEAKQRAEEAKKPRFVAPPDRGFSR